MNDLTEKLKELLMSCDCGPVKRLFNERRIGYYPSESLAEIIAKQLAPEIEKLMPRWIPVSELLPEDGQWIDLYDQFEGRSPEARYDNAHVYYLGRKYLFSSFTHWMPTPKGPTNDKR